LTAQNSKKTAPGRPFQKGQTGNPGGRPRIAPDVKEALAAASPLAAQRLVQLVKSDDEDVALKASMALLDRVYGKPSQPVEHSGLGELTDEQIEARYQALLSQGTATATKSPEPGE
jgi:hypothetical protein